MKVPSQIFQIPTTGQMKQWLWR